jgi:PIN domain nuclease of toxin-antitoxin system
MAVVLDTHAAIWYLSNSDQLSPDALNAIEGAIAAAEDVFLSAISLVEVLYLAEKGRLPADAVKRLENALRDGNSGIAVVPLDSAVAKAVARISRSVVPDMPDRIIAATAAHLGVPLVTRDRQIRAAGIKTIW